MNLNCSCPSDKVAGNGCFAAALMKSPEVVRDCIHAMSRMVQSPLSVWCRLVVDILASPEFSRDFVATAATGGCKWFIIHARKAWLSGFSQVQNKSVPPLLVRLRHLVLVRLCH